MRMYTLHSENLRSSTIPSAPKIQVCSVLEMGLCFGTTVLQEADVL
jgi:hypothetical protein